MYENISASTIKSCSERYERVIKRRRLTTDDELPVYEHNDILLDRDDTMTNNDNKSVEIHVQTDLTCDSGFDIPTHQYVEELKSELDKVKNENRILIQAKKSELKKTSMNEDDFKDNDKKVLYYTGLCTWELFRKLFEYIEPYLKTQSSLSPFQQHKSQSAVSLNTILLHSLHNL